MNAEALYIEATRRGLRLEPRGDKLAVLPGDRCPPDFANVLRAHKGELLSWLKPAPRNCRPTALRGSTSPGKSWPVNSMAQTVQRAPASLSACAPLHTRSAGALLTG